MLQMCTQCSDYWQGNTLGKPINPPLPPPLALIPKLATGGTSATAVGVVLLKGIPEI